LTGASSEAIFGAAGSADFRDDGDLQSNVFMSSRTPARRGRREGRHHAMIGWLRRKSRTFTIVQALFCAAILTYALPLHAADHGDAPLIAHDQGTDIGDVYFFLDPNDNTQVILAVTTHGFITPFENANLGFFDSKVRYHFQIENTGDAKGDLFIDVSFSKQIARTQRQSATVRFSGHCGLGVCPQTFTVADATTLSSGSAAVAPAQKINSFGPGLKLFAGLTDDPFFFDGPAELLYRASRIAGTPNPAVFARKRDAFAGYNILTIALSVPRVILEGPRNFACFGTTARTPCIGLTVYTQRRNPNDDGDDNDEDRDRGRRDEHNFVNLDRMGIPAVNTVFIRPLDLKDSYNRASTVDDAAGVFAGEIVAALTALKTTVGIPILAAIAVTNGDILRLNLDRANTGPSGGTNPGTAAAPAGFPNGRRLGDDVIDTIVTLVNDGLPVVPGAPMNPAAFPGFTEVDGVNANDVPLQSQFPFFAPATQPFPGGTIDDRTRN